MPPDQRLTPAPGRISGTLTVRRPDGTVKFSVPFSGPASIAEPDPQAAPAAPVVNQPERK